MRRFNPDKELKKIQRGNKKKIILFVISLLVVGVIGYSFALYQVRYSKRIIYTKVAPFSNSSDLDLAIYINGEKQSKLPDKDSGYKYSYMECDDGSPVAEWNEENWNFKQISNINVPNKCNVYFSDLIKEYTLTNKVEEFIIPKSGTYKLEVWGAQGGGNSNYTGGLGGYSTGVLKLNQNDHLYVVVGGSTTDRTGGYNGGGTGGLGAGYPNGYGGGGATHIAMSTGLLKELESNKESILIVAGGGGGNSIPGAGCTGVGAGGGLTAGDGRTCGGTNVPGATTDSGFAFGLGQNGRDAGAGSINGGEGNGGGGGGYYGGYSYQGYGTSSDAGGSGGSGYLSPLLLNASSQNGQNSGNGKAKITFLSN